jgi:broad specificity phosphatase PhoE
MPRVVLVRHGTASGKWSDGGDPGLGEVGRSEAAAVARCLAPLGPLAIVTSPLRRARETAAPLEARWGVPAVVEPRVGEIPPPPVPLADRADWLRSFLAGHWSAVGDELRAWRAELLGALTALPGDTVVFSHFVVINTVLGAATVDDRVLCRMIANCSTTTFDVEAGRVTLVETGEEDAATEVIPGRPDSA